MLHQQERAQSLAHSRRRDERVVVRAGWAASSVWFDTRAACTDTQGQLGGSRRAGGTRTKGYPVPSINSAKKRAPSQQRHAQAQCGSHSHGWAEADQATLLIPITAPRMSFYKGDCACLPLLSGLPGVHLPG